MSRKCGSCFRFREDRKDAIKKGLKPRELGDYEKKPRSEVISRCSYVYGPQNPKATDEGCKFHQYRFTWNIRIFYDNVKYKIGRIICDYIRRPIGRLRKPMALQWKDSFDGCRDIIIPNSEPVCPHCGIMPYSLDECVFCGQRFIQDDNTEEYSKPPEEERQDCVMCGGKNSVVGVRAKINGHFHGQCEKCGAVYHQ